MKSFFIYALHDPETGHLRYIGFTSISLEKRLDWHVRGLTGESPKVKWIKNLRAKGLKPWIFLIEEVKGVRFEAIKREIYCVKRAKSLGYNIVNSNDGGSGGNPKSPDGLARLKAAARGNTNMLGKHHTPEALARMRGHKLSKETCDKISLKMRGKTNRLGQRPTAETRAALSASHLGHPVSKETRDKLRTRQKLIWENQRQSAILEEMWT